MSQSNVLPFDDLSEASAAVADAVAIVRARFVEAADTMLHIDVRSIRPAAVRSFWPDIHPEPMDRVETVIRYRPSAAAISRAEEVMYGWLLDYARDDERRVLLGKWSMCIAAPHISGSFRQFCKKTGRVRRTAERRLFNEFQHIASELIKIPQSLQEPNWNRVSPMMPNSDTDFDKFREPLTKYVLHGMTSDAKPIYDPASPELAALIKRLEKANRRRQREKRAA
ncbi:DUF6362 family protein [Sinorhizobium meliloti]|uniref:DUF6362 family protein n=1 Tax=Rhizobium meliloti TaxID=382 RepID=UPI000FD736AA|nr:DUF6362 family protein [Sinorhizobium meliloti]RVG20282.1 hypothetical protein CN231_05570 [Sinorhizobium meliloti]